MKKNVVAIVISAAISHGAMAVDNYYLTGVGTDSCGDYLAMRAKFDRNAYEGSYATAVVEWVRGFDAGQNSLRSELGKRQSTYAVRPATVLAYVDKFCKDNPLGNVAAGSICLIAELRKEKLPEYCK